MLGLLGYEQVASLKRKVARIAHFFDVPSHFISMKDHYGNFF